MASISRTVKRKSCTNVCTYAEYNRNKYEKAILMDAGRHLDAFTNNQSVKDILREAGKVGGLKDSDSYTIVWRQTDAGVNSDQEEFTFKMK